eukprot:2646128-Prymnesium_polylepis.1
MVALLFAVRMTGGAGLEGSARTGAGGPPRGRIWRQHLHFTRRTERAGGGSPAVCVCVRARVCGFHGAAQREQSGSSDGSISRSRGGGP